MSLCCQKRVSNALKLGFQVAVSCPCCVEEQEVLLTTEPSLQLPGSGLDKLLKVGKEHR